MSVPCWRLLTDSARCFRRRYEPDPGREGESSDSSHAVHAADSNDTDSGVTMSELFTPRSFERVVTVAGPSPGGTISMISDWSPRAREEVTALLKRHQERGVELSRKFGVPLVAAAKRGNGSHMRTVSNSAAASSSNLAKGMPPIDEADEAAASGAADMADAEPDAKPLSGALPPHRLKTRKDTPPLLVLRETADGVSSSQPTPSTKTNKLLSISSRSWRRPFGNAAPSPRAAAPIPQPVTV